MEFLSKDKLAALEEEKQQRRKARAEQAQQRLAEVGKQTQQMVQDHVSPNNSDSQAQRSMRVGGLSRVLFEQATDPDGRRGNRKSRGNADPSAIRNAGFDALHSIDTAMRHINSVAQDATGAGMRGGLEDAARSVNDAVSRVSAAVNIGQGGRVQAAANNPLADIMQSEAEDSVQDHRGEQEHETQKARDPHMLENELTAGAAAMRPSLQMNLGSSPFGGIAHEVSHVIQQRGGLEGAVKDLGDTPEKMLGAATSIGRDVVDQAQNAPRTLLQAASNIPRETLAAAATGAVGGAKEALGRAADAPRQIADNLRDAPAHVADNVKQVAQHVAHNHASIANDLHDAVATGENVVRDVANVDPKAAVASVGATIQTAAQNLDPRNVLESAKENLDPRKLGAAALDQVNPRTLVEGAVNAAATAGIGPAIARNMDPRAIAEQTLGALDPRAQVRAGADPASVLANAPATGVQPTAGGATPANAAAAAPTNGAAPNATANATTTATTNASATAAPAAGAKPAPGGGDAKHVEAKPADPKHAEPKHAEAKHAEAKHGGGAAHGGGAPHAPANNSSQAPHAGTGGVQHAAAPHSSTAMPTPGNRTGAPAPTPPPAPSPTQAPHNPMPASERASTSSRATQPSKDRANVDIKSGGETQINPQPVPSVAPPIEDRKAQLTQPSFQIEAKADNGAVPPIPPAPEAPQTTAPPPAPAAPPAQVNTPTTAARDVAPLAPATPTPAPPPNPAIAAGRAAAAAVSVPQGSISPLPASNTSTAPGAAPAPVASAPVAAAVNTTAAPAAAPTAPPVPAAALPATPTPAAPATNSPAPAAPSVPAVKSAGGDNIPNPASLVQGTVSLSPDRTAATQAISTEAQTQSTVAPEAAAARQSQISPLAPQMSTTGHSADAPMTSANSSSQAEGASAAASGKASEAAKDAQGKQQIAQQMGGAQAERSQFAAMPPPAILQQTSAAAMAPVTQAAQTAIQSAANAVSQSPVNLDPAVVARGHAATAISSTLPPFDAARFNQIDQHAPLPPTNTASVDAATATSQGTYQQANQQIQTLANIPAPVINAPVGAGAGQKTTSGYPTREAAIAEIESQVTSQSNAQGPAAMKTAAAPVQDQLNTHVSTSQQGAQAQVSTKLSEAQSQAQAITQQAPPITGAQAAANAQPEYQQHQAAATLAHQNMEASVTQANQTAQTGVQTARTQRNQQVSTAQTGYTQDVQGQVMPQYTAAQASANQTFQQQHTTAEATLATDQQTAQTQAQSAAEQAKAKADADISSHQSAMDQQRQAALASHQQQAAAATAQHTAQMQQQQSQMDAQVASHQSEMHSQVAAQQAAGQAEVNAHLTEGEQGYQQQIASGTAQANAEKAKAEQEAAAKKAAADAEKKKHSGGILGGIIGWVKDRVDDLMNAMKAVLTAARDMVVSIMEKARQVAMSILEKARQAALAAMNKVKGAIQGIISAAASAIRSVISACAAVVKGLIQALANELKALVSALQTMLKAVVSAFQAAVNAALDMMIAAVSLVNKDLGDKLKNATQKYRDAFNGAMNGLKANIDKAGDALKSGIQAAADKACAVVDVAEQTLNAAVTQVENTLNAAVEDIYKLGAKAVNAAFDAAEFVVNKAFDIAEAGVKAFFDLQIAQLDLVQKGIDAVADFEAMIADKVMEAVDKIAQAVVSMIPDSWKKAFVDFWNGPWRSIIIIGLATVAAVALTVATGGIAGVLLAGLIGGSIAGGAYFGGEMVARESEISLSTEGKGMYISGFGDVQIGPDGKPIPPPGLSPEKLAEFNKQAGWAASNFNMQRDENGNVIGYDRKNATDISNFALQEGAKGFVEGAISGSLAVAGGGLGGLASKGLGFAEESVAGSLVSAGVSNVITGPVQQSMTNGFDAAFEAIKDGKNPAEAFKAGLGAAKDAILDPSAWITAGLTMGIAPVKLKFLEPLLEKGGKGVESAAVKTLIQKGGDAAFDTVTTTLATAGGAFAGTYAKALHDGKTPAQALEMAKKAANDAFTPEAIATNAFMSTAGAIAAKPHGETPTGEGAHPHTPEGEGHPTGSAAGGAGEHPTTGDHPSEASPSDHGPTNDHPAQTAPSSERVSNDPHHPIAESNEANARTASDPAPGPKSDRNAATEHNTSEPKPDEHPHLTGDSTPRATDKPGVTEATPRETPVAAEPTAASAHPEASNAVEPNKNEAPQGIHEPATPKGQISEHEPRLKAIEKNADGAPPEAVAAVREARSEITKLKRLRTRAENGTGVWEHATPEERTARVKTLEDQINNVADRAVEHYDRVANKPTSDAETLKTIQERTPEQVEARKKEVKQARDEIKARDEKLVGEVHKNTIKDASGEHVNQIYDHVTLGSGFAGTANEMSRPNVAKGDIVIGGANPWDGATSKFGQGAGQSELPNHQRGHGMVETASDPSQRYMLASEHADNVALNKNDSEIRTYNGTSGSIEPGPKADWPAFAREGGATARMKVTGPDGVERYFYTKQADVASGPGPNRRLPESVLDADTIKRMQDAKAFAFGDQSFGGDSVRPGEVANIGAGAAGAWGSEATANRVDEHGTRVNDVEWIGSHPDEAKQNAGTQRDKLVEIHKELSDAQASNDPTRIKAAQDALTKFTFEEAARNGNLPRNQEPGAAFDPKMQKGATSADGVPGNISRRVTDGVQKITFEPEVPGGPPRVKIVLKDKGPNGEPVVLWKDSLVLSIGQDAKGKGGPVELLKNYDGKLKPIYGDPDPKDPTFRPVVGVQSEDGSVRVLGAASTPEEVSNLMNQHQEAGGLASADHQDNLRRQASELHRDSKGVVGGFVLSQKNIEVANEAQRKALAGNNASLIATLEQTAEQQHASVAHPHPSEQPQPPPGGPANTDGPPVQRKASGEGVEEGLDHAEVARAGTAGTGGAMPHGEAIQRSFGRHDVSGIRAHVGGAAADSSRALGAKAYAHGSSVAFASSPDLHTAAHEAAHVVQQRAGVQVSGGMDGGSGDEHEKHADAVADAVVSGGSAEALLDKIAGGGGGEAVVQRKGDAGTEVIAREMTSKDKAKEMLAHTPPENRGTVESIIRGKFKKEDADEIISKTPSTGSAPKPKSAGKPKKTNAGADAKSKKGAKAAAKHSKMPTHGTAKTVAAKVAEKHEEGINDIGAFKGVSTGDLALVHQELIEHEEWKAAHDSVGDAGTSQRAGFIAEQTGKGVYGAAGMGLLTGAGGALLTKGVEKVGVAVAGEEIPGIGPIIAGAFSAYSLWTKNWKEAGEKISAIGTGTDTYDTLANTLAGIAEIIDIVVNVLNVIAAVVAAIGLIMWIVTICTLGAAAPLAITLTEIAAGVVTATLILDALAKLVINPMVLLFRAMHTFKSDADPRDVKEQGDVLSETANQTVGFVANIYGGKAAEAGVEHLPGGKPAAGGTPGTEDRSGGPEVKPEHTPEAKTETPPEHAPETKPETPPEHEGKPPENQEAKPGDKPGEKPGEKPGDKPDTRSREEKLADARKKAEEAETERDKIHEKTEEALKKNREARETAKKARETARETNEKNLETKLKDIETARQNKLKDIETARKGTLDKVAGEAKTSDEALANAKTAQTTQHEAAAKTRESTETAAKDSLDSKTQTAQEHLNAAETEAATAGEHGANTEFATRESAVESKHAESVTKLSSIEDPELRAQRLADENTRYNAEKSALATEKAQRAAELAKPSTDAAKAQYEHDVATAKADHDQAVRDAATAERDTNAKTDREFTDAKAAHDAKARQLDGQGKRANEKADRATRRADEDAHTDSDKAETDRETADKKADGDFDKKAKDLKADNDRVRKAGNKDERHAEHEVEEAEKEVGKNEYQPWRIIRDWVLKPLFVDPYDPWKNNEKAHKDIDLLGPNETRQNNAKAAAEKKEKPEKEKREEALRPKDPGDEGVEHEDEAAKKAHEETVERNKKYGAIGGGAVGLFAGGVVAAPWTISAGAKRGSDFGEGLAGKEPETRAQIDRHVSPKYVDPPGTLEQLAQVKEQIESDLAARAAWATKKSKELEMQGKEKHNSEQLAEAQKMAKEATEASNQHKEAVERKDASIEAQAQRNKQAGQQGADGAHRLAGMAILEVPLKAFQAVTWIGAKVGSTKFAEMNNDANQFASKLEQMKTLINGSKQASDGQGAAITADKATNQATKAKSAQTTAQMVKTETGFGAGKTKVDGAVAKRGANAAAATTGEAKSGADAKAGESKYGDLSQKLTSWAKQHQQARLEAKELAHQRDEAQKAAKGGAAKKEGGPPGETGKPTVAGEPKGLPAAPTVAHE